MKIKVGRYTLYSDSMSMWINEEYEIKKGKHAGELKERRVTGYSTSLKNLLRSFRDTKVSGTDAESLDELLSVLRSVYDDMVEINTVAVEKGFERIGKLK